jgi:hypothetical protein
MDPFWLGFGLGGILGASSVAALAISDLIHRVRRKLEIARQMREEIKGDMVIHDIRIDNMPPGGISVRSGHFSLSLGETPREEDA